MEILSEFGAHKIKLFSRVEFMNFNWSSLISQQMRQYDANEGWCVGNISENCWTKKN